MFKIGDKVLCIDNKDLFFPTSLLQPLEVGKIYTIRGIDPVEGDKKEIGVYLEEILSKTYEEELGIYINHRSKRSKLEIPLHEKRFRKIGDPEQFEETRIKKELILSE